MTVFPNGKAELKLGSTWTDITSYVYNRDGVGIKRGRANETTRVEPAALSMTLDNRDGRFSARNPSGPYYGSLSRNTALRWSVPGDGSVFLRVPGNYGVDNISTPDNAALDITGDIDIRFDAYLSNWQQYQTLVGKWAYNGTSNSWIFYIGPGGDLRFAHSLDGTSTVGSSSTHIAALATGSLLTDLVGGARQAVRVTLATATGVVTFYRAATIAGPWTALTTLYGVGPSAGTIFSGSEPVIIAESGQGRTPNVSVCAGKINAVQILNGIGGTAVANPDFTTLSIGTTSFADAAGRTWTLNGDTEVTDRSYRGYFEVSEWPPRWDVSGRDVYTPISAAGVLRRLGQGTEPVTSPLKRSITSSTSMVPIAYWPCEDLTGATSFDSSGKAQNMTFTGSPSLASDTHIGGSSALPQISNSVWTGNIPGYTNPSPTSWQIAFVYYLNSTPTDNAVLVRAYAGAYRFDYAYNTGAPGFFVNVYNTSDGSLASSDLSGGGIGGATATIYDGGFHAYQSGSSLHFGPDFNTTGTSGSGDSSFTGTLSKVTKIVIDPDGNYGDTVIGHIAVYAPRGTNVTPLTSARTGSAGETAGNRFARLCLESGIQPRTYGNPDDSPQMGGQGADTLLNLLQDCIDVDGGLFYEPRDVLGIGMRMRSSLFDETSSVTLSHASGHLSGVLEPTDDDQQIRNDITITNSTTGSIVRATQDIGTLNTANPPAGVGRYPDTLTLNLFDDNDLIALATWAVHVGTVDESRFPVIQVQLEGTAYSPATGAFSQSVQNLDIGQIITLTGMPAWMPPDDTRQLIQGITEVFTAKSWIIQFNSSPGSPYDVLILDDTTYGRLDTDGSTLHASLTSSATSFQVDVTGAATGSPLWTTAGGDVPFDIIMNGERMTVTAVSGATSPQTFTVTRSVNGVVKAHSAGESLSLFRPFYIAPY